MLETFPTYCSANTEMLNPPFSGIQFSHSTAAVLVSDELAFTCGMLTAQQLPLYEFSVY